MQVDAEKAKAKLPKVPMASISELYQFTSGREKTMLIVAFVCALGAGVAQPMMLIAFNSLFTQLGSSEIVGGAMVSEDKTRDLLLILSYIGAALFVCDFISISSVNYVAASMMNKYKQAYLKAVLRQDVGWYDTSNPEELSTQFAEAMVKVQKGLKAQNMLCIGLGMGGGSLVMAFLPTMGQPEVAGMTMATVPVLIIAASGMMYLVENGERLRAKSYGRAGGVATECLFSMRTIVALGAEYRFEERYKSSLSKVRRVTIVNQSLFMCSVGMAGASYLLMVAVAVIYGAFRLSGEIEDSRFPLTTVDPISGAQVHYCADATQQPTNISINAPCGSPLYMTCQLGGAMELAGDTKLTVLAEQSAGVFTVPPGLENQTLLGLLGFSSTADLSSFVIANGPQAYLQSNARYYACGMAGANILLAIFAIMFMGEGFSMAGQPWQYFNLGRQAAARVLTIIARVPTIDSFSEEGLKPASVKGDIEVRDVRFAYPTAPDHLVCKGYSLSIRAGETVALCGPSGSGKSTIIQLLERFYDPLSGSITLDGADLTSLNVRWLRSQLGLVGQEPVLFQGTVATNIAYGKQGESTQAEIEEAARMANAHGFITTTLAKGYSTDVGLKGGKLSGGQKQRVAIARAIIKKPAVLLLDEATSALDNESERIVQAALDEIMAKLKRTTIVIAHRLSTIRTADKIAVISEGAVVEEGTHDELLAQHGMYTNLVLSC